MFSWRKLKGNLSAASGAGEQGRERTTWPLSCTANGRKTKSGKFKPNRMMQLTVSDELICILQVSYHQKWSTRGLWQSWVVVDSCDKMGFVSPLGLRLCGLTPPALSAFLGIARKVPKFRWSSAFYQEGPVDALWLCRFIFFNTDRTQVLSHVLC